MRRRVVFDAYGIRQIGYLSVPCCRVVKILPSLEFQSGNTPPP
jgi:hypothetical protein